MPRFPIQHLADLSRDRRFLIRISLSIVVMSVALSLVLALYLPRKVSELVEGTPAEFTERAPVHNSSESIPTSIDDWVFWIRFQLPQHFDHSRLDFRALSDAERGFIPFLGKSPFGEFPLLEAYYLGLVEGGVEQAIEGLKSFPENVRYRNEFIGDIYILDQDYQSALQAYTDEAKHYPKSSYAHRSAVIAALRDENREKARNLLTQPEVAEYFDLYEQINLQADTHAWLPLLKTTFKLERSRLVSFFAVPAAFTTLIWYLILTNFWKFDRTRLIASTVALAAGIISANLTLYAVMIQDRALGFTHDETASQLSQVIYFVAGVGLREETLKLLCFIPIAIWCSRRKNDLEALILAALVGLGFAAMENISYFSEGILEQKGLSRLLTANPVHFTLTGLVGFYAYRMIVRKFHGLEEFLATFILAVLFHGAYDAIILIPGWQDYAIINLILMALLVYRYFDPLRNMMDIHEQRKRLSPLGIFIMGSVSITCIVMIVSAPVTGFKAALATFAEAVGSLIPLAFAYISRFRDL